MIFTTLDNVKFQNHNNGHQRIQDITSNFSCSTISWLSIFTLNPSPDNNLFSYISDHLCSFFPAPVSLGNSIDIEICKFRAIFILGEIFKLKKRLDDVQHILSNCLHHVILVYLIVSDWSKSIYPVLRFVLEINDSKPDKWYPYVTKLIVYAGTSQTLYSQTTQSLVSVPNGANIRLCPFV